MATQVADYGNGSGRRERWALERVMEDIVSYECKLSGMDDARIRILQFIGCQHKSNSPIRLFSIVEAKVQCKSISLVLVMSAVSVQN